MSKKDDEIGLLNATAVELRREIGQWKEVSEAANRKLSRAEELLRAAYDLLRRANDSTSVVAATEIEVRYDGADCDGLCLLEDIAGALGLGDAAPIPLESEAE